MTNELDDGDYIVEFVSGGANNYRYLTKNGKIFCKLRRCSLNVRGSKQLNYQIIKQNIQDKIQHPLDERRNTDVLNPLQFVWEPATKKLKTVPQVKNYGLVFEKKAVNLKSFISYPVGYSTLNEEDIENINILNEFWGLGVTRNMADVFFTAPPFCDWYQHAHSGRQLQKPRGC